MNSENVHFTNKEGIELSAKLDLPISGKVQHYAIFAHCFTCNKNLNAVRSISSAMTNNQIAVLRFDFTGLGDSEGDFSETNFSSNVNDIIAASEFLSEHYEKPELLVGHSLGGAGVLFSANAIDSIKAIATIGAPSNPEHIKKLFTEKIEVIKEKGEAEVNIGGRSFKIKKQFLEDVNNTDFNFKKHKHQPAILIMHSPQDNIVGINNAREIYERLMHPKSFITLNGSDHLISKKEEAIYAGELIAKWAMRYLSKKEKDVFETHQSVAVRTHSDSFTTEIVNGKHSLIADEPKDVGGDDLGPSPYELLLSALGTCTSMTLKLYLDKKGWNYKNIEVHLSHRHNHSEDAKNPENPSGKIDEIERDIIIEGDFTEEQKNKIIEIADKCPVHRTLHSPTVVNTRWKD